MHNLMSKEEFDREILKADGIVLVDFYADWCGPCKMLEPTMEEISKEQKVYRINIDNNEDLAVEYGIMSIPCVIAFKDGKELNRSIGLVPKERIMDLIK